MLFLLDKLADGQHVRCGGCHNNFSRRFRRFLQFFKICGICVKTIVENNGRINFSQPELMPFSSWQPLI